MDRVVSHVREIDGIYSGVANLLRYLLRCSAPNEGAGYNDSKEIEYDSWQWEDVEDAFADGFPEIDEFLFHVR